MNTVLLSSAKWAIIVSLSAALLTACNSGDKKQEATGDTKQPTAQTDNKPAPAAVPAASTSGSAADAYKIITDEMSKSKDSKPDYALVSKTYNEKLKSLVQKRDSENNETNDAFITAAIEGTKDGKMDGMVATQLVDKLLQKVMYVSVKAAFKDVTTNWTKPEDAKKALAEAKLYYKPVLESTVKKRDDALKTTMVDTINGAFSQMDSSIGNPTTLSFDLARQVIDKTLMKTFYLAIASKDSGYAYKIEKGAAEGKDVKVEQAEAWAFYQSILKYVEGQAKEDSDFVNKQFDLSTDPKTVKGDSINGALVRGMVKVALDEYVQSQKSWGTDKAAVTGLEGAIFIDLLYQDIARLLGDAGYKTLRDQADQYNSFVKDNNKDEAAAVLQKINASLNDVIAKTSK
jgi:hypothetical protein